MHAEQPGRFRLNLYVPMRERQLIQVCILYSGLSRVGFFDVHTFQEGFICPLQRGLIIE